MAPTTAERANYPFGLSRFVDAQDRVYPQALAEVAQQHSVFQHVLERYFHGERDRLTVDILKADRSRRQGPLPNR